MKDGVFQVSLKPAVSARGVIIDAATDRPVPNAVVFVYPRRFREAAFRGFIEARTDAKGEFEYSTLESIDYRANVRGAAIRGTLIEMLPGGGYRLNPPPGATEMFITGGSEETHRLEVELIPGQGLKPAEK